MPGNDTRPRRRAGASGLGPATRRSALAARRGRGVEELAGLVVPVHGDRTELRAVLTPVVGAEQQLAPARELDTEVGLRTTTVAAVAGGQGACCDCGGHDGPSFLSDAVRRRWHWGPRRSPSVGACLPLFSSSSTSKHGQHFPRPPDRRVRPGAPHSAGSPSVLRRMGLPSLPRSYDGSADGCDTCGFWYRIVMIGPGRFTVHAPVTEARRSTTRTTPTTSWSSRASRPSARDQGCTSARPTPGG